MTILLKSALKEAVDALPAALKPQQLKPALKKAGVKDEEIEMSGIGVLQPRLINKEGKVYKKDLQANESMARLDEFNTKEYRGGPFNDFPPRYSSVVPAGVEPVKQNYVERVYTFTHPEGVLSASNHFPDSDYLMHTRVYDDLIGDQETRVVAEIQSDLHQKNKAAPAIVIPDEELEVVRNSIEAFRALPNKTEAEITSKLADFVYTEFDNTGVKISRQEAADKAAKIMANPEDTAMLREVFTAAPKVAAWETTWPRKGLENEVLNAIADGKSQIAIPIKTSVKQFEPAAAELEMLEDLSNRMRNDEIDFDSAAALIMQRFPRIDEDSLINGGLIDYMYDDADRFVQQVRRHMPEENPLSNMHRSSGVQKWYETYVGPLAQKLAKQTNSEFRTETKDGVEYAVIKFTPNTKADFKLYSTGGGLAMYMAYQQGYKEDEVTTYMREQGFTDEDIAKAKAQQAQIGEAKAQGYEDAEIQQFLEAKEPKAVVEAEKPEPPKTAFEQPEQEEAYKALTSETVLPADELIAALQVVRPNMATVTTRASAFTGNDEAIKVAQAAEEAAIKNISELAAQRGLDISWNGEDWVAETPDGPVVVTPGILQQMAAEKGELIGGTAGAIIGAEKGAAVGGSNPYAKAGGFVLGGLMGGMIGAAAGTQLDYLYQSMQLQEDMSAEIAMHKATTAQEAAVYGEVLGAAIAKPAMWIGKAAWQLISRAKNMFIDGNTEGARKALRETMFLTDQQIDELIEQFEKSVDTTGMSRAQREISAVATMLPGGEDLVKAAASIDPQASRAVVKAIDDRAKQLAIEVDKVAEPTTARTLKQDLQLYQKDVKQFYEDVKQQAVSSPRAKYYKFDFDKTAVMPVLTNLRDGISDPTLREKFVNQLNNAKKFTKGRTFGDLIELRHVVNGFRFNKNIAKAKDYAALDQLIQSIDTRIEAGARFVMNNPTEWLANFATARSRYAEMMTLQRNALVKVVNRPGVTPEEVSNQMLKYSDAIDGTYEQVMHVLPKRMRELAEADMLKTLTKKYTVGDSGALQATQFPMLAEELNKRSFVSEDARAIKQAVIELADTFKNDVALARNVGFMQVPQFQSYLTADPVVRAKFAVASTVFNKMQEMVPGSKASNNIALIRNTAKFLETPLNAKSVAALKESAKDVVSLDESILAVQREQAEATAKSMDNGTTIVLYGSGNTLSPTGSGTPAMRIPAHRIATPEIIKHLSNIEGVPVDNKEMDEVLKRYAYKAVVYGSDKVRVLK